MRRTMGWRAGWGLLAVWLTLAAPAPALAHNVTFRAAVSVAADGAGLTVTVDDIIRNPVTGATVSVTAGGGGRALLAETGLGVYTGVLPRPLQGQERLTVQVQAGRADDTWSGGGLAAAGGAAEWVLHHQHGIDGRTLSITMTAVFGGLLVVIAVHETVRRRRRRPSA